MRGRVPNNQRIRARVVVGYDEENDKPIMGMVEGTTYASDGPFRQGIDVDGHGHMTLQSLQGLVDPKTGVMDDGDGKVRHDPNPPLDHNQPSQAKSLYQCLAVQAKQIQLLGKMMKMLMGVKMAGPMRDENGQIIPPSINHGMQYAPHIDQSKWYDQDPDVESDPFGRDELNDYDWGPNMYRLPDGRLVIEGRETPPKEQ